jgi:hypothetical protein
VFHDVTACRDSGELLAVNFEPDHTTVDSVNA